MKLAGYHENNDNVGYESRLHSNWNDGKISWNLLLTVDFLHALWEGVIGQCRTKTRISLRDPPSLLPKHVPAVPYPFPRSQNAVEYSAFAVRPQVPRRKYLHSPAVSCSVRSTSASPFSLILRDQGSGAQSGELSHVVVGFFISITASQNFFGVCLSIFRDPAPGLRIAEALVDCFEG